MLPTRAPPARPSMGLRPHMIDIAQYSPITDRNIFNADGKIPPALTSDGKEGPGMEDAAPVLTQLPLKLEGTLVHANPKKSVATINAKSGGNEAKAYSVDNEIESMARVIKIERRKVIFRNLNNQRLEYVEIPKDNAVSFGMKDPVISGEEVQRKGEFEFTMNRADITKYTNNLSAILNQAAMVPNIIPGSGGRVEGFRFVSIQPGSIYEKLGFKPMDVIKMVNGEAINSPTKAMELYNALKSEKNISMTVNRDGKDEDFRYNIND